MRYKVLLSCEHASFRCPASFAMQVSQRTLRSHRGWDPGAALLARSLARQNGWPLYCGKLTRLLIDLNRSAHHPNLFSSFSHPLSTRLKARLKKEYLAYRYNIRKHLEQISASGYLPVHLSAHSFTPVFHGQKRRTEIGILFDPARKNEQKIAEQLKVNFAQLKLGRNSLQVDYNRPYQGTEDGLVQSFRQHFQTDKYVGLEIEISQKLVRAYGSSLNKVLTQAFKFSL